MDPNKIDFKSNKKPHFVFEEWEFHFYDMRVYNSRQQSWYRFRMRDDNVTAQLYPHGFFWNRIPLKTSDVAGLQSAYAEYILLEECE